MGKRGRGGRFARRVKRKQIPKKRPDPAAPPQKFDVAYGTPRDLVTIGPIIKATWSVPAPLKRKLAAAGRPVPASISGRLLVDTGATSTCISSAVASELGLQVVDTRETYGAHGLQKTDIVLATLTISISNDAGLQTLITRDQLVSAVPDLETLFQQMGVRDGNVDSGRLIGLLGRDFLRHAILTYNGPKGRITIEIDPSHMKEKPAP